MTATGVTDSIESTTPTELHARIDSDEDVFLLDVRSAADFDAWHIDGPTVEVVHYPYFQLLEGIPDTLHAKLPDDQPITVVCAKGDSSELVAERLEEAGYDSTHLEHGMRGWARVYEFTTLDTDSNATIAQYRRPSSGCLASLVVSDGEAAVIDPLRAFTDEYLRDVRAFDAELRYALDTHIHADHVSGVRELAGRTGATAVVPEAAAARGVDYDVAFDTVANGDTLSVGTVDIDVIHAPGHTAGMTAYEVENVLFTGDGLFTDSVARPDLEDPAAARNAARTLYGSLTRTVSARPAETIVAPAHSSDSAVPTDGGAVTATLGELTETLAALSMDETEFVEFVAADLPPRPANYETIIAANLGAESLDDATAFELELGPNNCAAN
ncbi:MBL fold metallo-hydrolase [Natrialba taiwanensis]|uniref:Zn-dependent hydrolase n=1 Tax=Natrialba taiwanensis DSM 12281 TaxID=1230458 RepID=M0A0C6_9EURY|nr:MBL fold metallo-hydrolase [Natrialba taiwanensis]ELY92210.1 Zn-dependent hydrolase [Natrialba taiwanensis DSM 12281]